MLSLMATIKGSMANKLKIQFRWYQKRQKRLMKVRWSVGEGNVSEREQDTLPTSTHVSWYIRTLRSDFIHWKIALISSKPPCLRPRTRRHQWPPVRPLPPPKPVTIRALWNAWEGGREGPRCWCIRSWLAPCLVCLIWPPSLGIPWLCFLFFKPFGFPLSKQQWSIEE